MTTYETTSIRGEVDGLEGAYVVGWALNNEGRESRIVVRDETGKVVGKGRANRYRPDLTTLGIGKSNIAFRVPVNNFGDQKYLHVFADDIEITRAPLAVGRGHFSGTFAVNNGVAHGWVTERSHPFGVLPLVTIIDQNGRNVSKGQPHFSIMQSDPLFPQAEFWIELADSCFNKSELYLTATANEIAFANHFCSLSVLGTLETLSERRCSGWLYSPQAPNRRLSIDVFVKGSIAGTGETHLVRKDVEDMFPDCGACGFDIAIAQNGDSPLELSTVSIRLHEDGEDLFEGPYVIGSVPAVVAAARKVANRLYSGRDGLTSAEQAVARLAISDLLQKTRRFVPFIGSKIERSNYIPTTLRMNIVIPIYRGTQTTADCIHSVLAYRNQDIDRVVLVNDCSPEPGMAEILRYFSTLPNVILIDNATNVGFIHSVNKALRLCSTGDVLLLNSDTLIYPGSLEEMWSVLHSELNIGTVTALSNNATVFSYPHPSVRSARLDDLTWVEVAEFFAKANRGKFVDTPTGHGFCMLVRRGALDQAGLLDASFGRGYGEENDLCARVADIGYRNVAAVGAFVLHLERISFGDETEGLLERNLRILESRYPEYTPTIMEFERTDPIRQFRWSLDRERLRRAGETGQSFAIVISNYLGGGTRKAANDIERAVGYGSASPIHVEAREDGFICVRIDNPKILAVFAPVEVDALFELLSSAPVSLIVVHQLLGFDPAFSKAFKSWSHAHKSVFYAHDYYPICPRVTMIDANGTFCDLAKPSVCERCVAIGGEHETARSNGLPPDSHREHYLSVLKSFRYVIAPSESAAAYYGRAFPELKITVVPHPEPQITFPTEPRAGSDDEILLLGAIGRHKGSGKLLELASRARLVMPALHFRVVGFTDIDAKLLELGNVSIAGSYKQGDEGAYLRNARGRLALFLQIWPETYSYTLTEVVARGFIPIVPDIGAPAERVRKSGYGVVFSFPFSADDILSTLDAIRNGSADFYGNSRPCDFGSPADLAWTIDKLSNAHRALS